MKLLQPIRSLYEQTVSYMTEMRHRVSNSMIYFLHRTDWSKSQPDQSSIIIACVRWIQRTYSEAPFMLQRWDRTQQQWESFGELVEGDVLWLLKRPNPYYSGIQLMKAIVADRVFEGTGYILKRRAVAGNVLQLWWLPACTMHAVGDETTFIKYYEYTINGVMYYLRPQDVIRLPDGMDPDDPTKGNAPVKCLLREVYTDDEAAEMTAVLMKNMGVPGVVISPKEGRIPREIGKGIKEEYKDTVGGANRGEALVLEGAVEVHEFGFSPQQLNMRDIRGLPEERITAVIGVNAAVVGLGAGLNSTKVGATLKEYREEAFESTIIPLYREVAEDMTTALLWEFYPIDQWRLTHDLTQVRVLQDDENALSERLIAQVRGGLITIAEARRKLGHPVLPEHDVFLRPRSLQVVPVGTSPQEQQAASGVAGNPVGRPIGSHNELPVGDITDEQIRKLLGERVPA